MTGEEHKEIIRRWVESACNRGDFSMAPGLYDRYVMHGPGLPFPVQGPEGIKQFITAYRTGLPDLHLTIEDMVAEGDKVVWRFTATGTHLGDFFTWGTLLAGTGNMAFIGMLFTTPQYFQAILGTNAQGAGLRLLPLIAGLVIGAVPADRLAGRIGAKLVVALGFALLATGLGLGAATSINSGDAFAAAWTALCGAGVGLALATATTTALAEISAERSGVGSAVMQAVQKLGSPFGAALLGSVLNAAYRSQVPVAGLSAATFESVQKSVFAGLAVARQLQSPFLQGAVRVAFVAGMDAALAVAAGMALVGLALAVAFLPQRAGALGRNPAKGVESLHDVVASH